MTIFVTWHTRVTVDSIRNSCDVYSYLYLYLSIEYWAIWEKFPKNTVFFWKTPLRVTATFPLVTPRTFGKIRKRNLQKTAQKLVKKWWRNGKKKSGGMWKNQQNNRSKRRAKMSAKTSKNSSSLLSSKMVNKIGKKLPQQWWENWQRKAYHNMASCMFVAKYVCSEGFVFFWRPVLMGCMYVCM